MAYSLKRVLLSGYFIRFLFFILPDRARRMLFVISLAQLIRGKEALTLNTLEKINAMMELGFSNESIQYPTYIVHLIWKSLSPESVCGSNVLCMYKELDADTIAQAVASVKSHVNDLELYDPAKMDGDIEKILRNRDLLLSAA